MSLLNQLFQKVIGEELPKPVEDLLKYEYLYICHEDIAKKMEANKAISCKCCNVRNISYARAKKGIYDCQRCQEHAVCCFCDGLTHILDVDNAQTENEEFWYDISESSYRISRCVCLKCNRGYSPSLNHKKLTHSKFPYEMREDDGEYYTYEEFCEFYTRKKEFCEYYSISENAAFISGGVSGVARWEAAETSSIFAHRQLREDDGDYYTYEQFCEYYQDDGSKWKAAQPLRLTEHLS